MAQRLDLLTIIGGKVIIDESEDFNVPNSRPATIEEIMEDETADKQPELDAPPEPKK